MEVDCFNEEILEEFSLVDFSYQNKKSSQVLMDNVNFDPIAESALFEEVSHP